MIQLVKSSEDLVLGDGPLAIDTEFHSEGTYHPRLHLIQVCSRGGPAQLIDPHDDVLLREVAPRLVERPWLVHAGEHDLPILQRALGGVPAVVHDTQLAAGLVDTRYPAGLAWLLSTWCDIELAKAETLSDWSRRPLTSAQQRYAALDVLHLHELWDRLWARAQELDRTDVVEACCRTERDRVLDGPDLGELWTRLPGAHGLDGIASSVLQELAVWRERQAESADRPPHAVMAPRILTDLAKRRPTDAKQLLLGRRAPKKVLRAHSDEILGIIRRAEARPRFAHADPMRPGTLLHARWSWWTAFAEIEGLRRTWAARLVLPPDTRRMLARGQTVVPDWRQALLGDEFDQARAGTRTLSLPTDP